MYRMMRILLSGLFLATAGCEMPGKRGGSGDRPIPGAVVFGFDADAVGKLPCDWRVCQTRPSTVPATWTVVQDGSAPTRPNVLALTNTQSPKPTFNLVLAEKSLFKDVDLSVKVRGNTGEIDQGGGPVWRCKDENNYYICRINPLENNYRVYRVVNGHRRQLASADVKLDAGRWYTLRARMVGDRIVCHLNGKKLLEARDGTIPWAGKVGLWTKADAATSFDDVRVQPVSRP